MTDETLSEETISSKTGHSRVTIKVELGEGIIDLIFEGREAPTVTYRYDGPDDVLAIGAALTRAANISRAIGGMETG